jgi:hypothetical protein
VPAATRLTPAQKARTILENARAQNEPFARAWQRARDTALEGIAGEPRRDWRTALHWAAPYFQAAYYRDPNSKCGRTLDN